MVKYLLDSCIWRDFYEDRVSLRGNPLGKYAAKLFAKIMKEKNVILYSDVLIKELCKYFERREVEEMLALFHAIGLLIKREITASEMKEAIEMADKRLVPVSDCLHAILARDHEAIVITQDRHYFNELSGITKAVRPQDII